jgi:hypothetical protein
MQVLDRIPSWFWTFVGGAFLVSFVFAVTFGYLPSPRELFRDIAAECRQTTIDKDHKANGGKKSAHTTTTTLQQPNTETTEDKAAKQKEMNDCLLAGYTGNLADFTKWLVFVTGALALFGFWQVIISRRTARKELRAYISAEPDGIIMFNPDDRVVGRVRFVNRGKIFAKDVRTKVKCILSNDGDLKENAFPIDESELTGDNVIAPNADIRYAGDAIFKRDIDAGREAAIQANKYFYLYVWGMAQYHDGFTDDRFTKFCHRYNFRSLPTGEYIIRKEDYRYHHRGNKIDDKD